MKGAEVCHFLRSDAEIGSVKRITVQFERTSDLRQFIQSSGMTSTMDLLEAVQDDLFRSLPHQFASSVRTENAPSPRSSMFNTLFNFRNSRLSGFEGGPELDFETLWSEDPMDVSQFKIIEL